MPDEEDVKITEDEETFIIDYKRLLPTVIDIINKFGPLSLVERGVVISRVLTAYYTEAGAVEFALMVSDLIPQMVSQDNALAAKAALITDTGQVDNGEAGA
jgi:hypothetical protein